MAPSRSRLEAFAQALAMGQSAADAARTAGYPQGGSFEANARKRAQRQDVKARVAELRAPHLAKVDEAIGVSVDWATRHLKEVADKALTDCEPTVADGIRSIDLLGKYHGWVPAGAADGDDKTPTVIKFQLNIFDSQRNQTIEHEALAVLPKPNRSM
jgi:hypothetical protein